MKNPRKMTTVELKRHSVKKYRMVVRQLYPNLIALEGRLCQQLDQAYKNEAPESEIALILYLLDSLGEITTPVTMVQEILDIEDYGILTPQDEYELLTLCEEEIKELRAKGTE